MCRPDPVYIILGTAGHIDHGKSALVKALTGIDPDRLKEEKERGITIDLGFAYLTYPEGIKIGIVDVPGHERLIKNMLAGAGGIDIVLMVIAADEGVMPQTKEHLDICNLLRVKRGIIAITKTDLVDEEWLELVKDDIKNLVRGTFLEGAEMIPVSSKTGQNIGLLKDKIKELASGVEPKSTSGIFRLPVDRVFTVKGFGTVVTGTALSGSISIESQVIILPKGIRTKVRELQSHGTSIERAFAGQRVAINLQAVAKEDIERGDVITIPDTLQTTTVIDAHVSMIGDDSIGVLKNRSLIHFHTGTTELTGRIIIYGRDELRPGEGAFCQFRFSSPLAVMAGDRYIIRKFSPLITLGGGEILDPSPPRKKGTERIRSLERLKNGPLREKLSLKIRQRGLAGITIQALNGWINEDIPLINKEIESMVNGGEVISVEGHLIHTDVFNDFSRHILSLIDRFHKKNPLKPGMPKEILRTEYRWLDQKVFEGLINRIKGVVTERDIARLETFSITIGDDKRALMEQIQNLLNQAGFKPLTKDELSERLSVSATEVSELLRIMASEKRLVRINDSIYIPTEHYSLMIKKLKEFFANKKEMTVGEFRDLLNTTRKYALPLLEYLDTNKITLRVGEVRRFLGIKGDSP